MWVYWLPRPGVRCFRHFCRKAKADHLTTLTPQLGVVQVVGGFDGRYLIDGGASEGAGGHFTKHLDGYGLLSLWNPSDG